LLKRIVKQTPKRRSKYYVPAFYLLLVAIWQGLFSLRLIPDYLFPSPIQVARRLWELGSDGLLWPGIKATLGRMAIGFSIAAGIGLLIGVLMGVSRVVNLCLNSLFLGLQTLPTVAWVPISLLLFGLSEWGIYFVIIMSSVAAIAIATSDGILHIPTIYLRAAAHGNSVLCHVLARHPAGGASRRRHGHQAGLDARMAWRGLSRADQIERWPGLPASPWTRTQ
jgi:NitT/TauT family transport system permease protein